MASCVMVDAESLVVQDVIARVGGRLRAATVFVVATTAIEEEGGILDAILVAGLVLPAEDLEGRQATLRSAAPVRVAGAGAGRPSLLLWWGWRRGELMLQMAIFWIVFGVLVVVAAVVVASPMGNAAPLLLVEVGIGIWRLVGAVRRLGDGGGAAAGHGVGPCRPSP